jgi:hypothetical protein
MAAAASMHGCTLCLASCVVTSALPLVGTPGGSRTGESAACSLPGMSKHGHVHVRSPKIDSVVQVSVNLFPVSSWSAGAHVQRRWMQLFIAPPVLQPAW